MTKISILGAGWLGYPLANKLLHSGFNVQVSCTSDSKVSELKKAGFTAFNISLPTINTPNSQSFFNSDILIITLPFKRSLISPNSYLIDIKTILSHCNATTKHILFTSSTSVYNNSPNNLNEDSPIIIENDRQKILLDCEKTILSHPTSTNTILRFGGLYGYDRKLTNFMTKSSQTKHINAPVNLIHQDDAVSIMEQIIHQKKWGHIYNAVSNEHPTRHELYSTHAARQGIKVPEFITSNESAYKIIDNQKLIKDLRFKFKYPNPLSDYE